MVREDFLAKKGARQVREAAAFAKPDLLKMKLEKAKQAARKRLQRVPG